MAHARFTRFFLPAIGLATLLVCGSFVTSRADAQRVGEPASLIISWNANSRQFIDPPVFKLLPLPGAAAWRATVLQGGKTWSVQSTTPTLDLKKIWPELAVKKFTLTVDWLDAGGGVVHSEARQRVKAPDFKGPAGPALDWAAAADRNVAYLIHAADHSPVPYRQPGVPAWIWAATPKHVNGFPCITINNIIWAFLAHAQNGGSQSGEALRLARVSADWALKNRQPDSGALPLFPYSTISKGKFGGGVEGSSVNLLRASWLAMSFVDLYKVTRHEPYLAYARHIADTTIKFQAKDGSFPYRVDPKTGAVIDEYSANATEFVELVDALEPFGHSTKRALAARRALDWTIDYVCASNNWQAAFEDVGETRPYVNLSQRAVHPLIRYLCRHKDEDLAWLPLARRLNRWVEDQFVTFGPDDEASPVRARGPLVFEQFFCWYPMETHTAHWIRTLIALHRATGEDQYLDKARAAADAICSAQYPNGEFSTLGRDWQTGKKARDGENWYNCNAYADRSLYELTAYCRSLKKRR